MEIVEKEWKYFINVAKREWKCRKKTSGYVLCSRGVVEMEWKCSSNRVKCHTKCIESIVKGEITMNKWMNKIQTNCVPF